MLKTSSEATNEDISELLISNDISGYEKRNHLSRHSHPARQLSHE